MSRKERRAFAAQTTFFRVVPMFQSTDGKTLEDSVQVSLVDGDLKDAFVIRVPPTTSTKQAKQIEADFTAQLGKPCLVVTRNIEFCRVEPVERSKLAHLLKGAENTGLTPAEKQRQRMLAGTMAGALANTREQQSADEGDGEETP